MHIQPEEVDDNNHIDVAVDLTNEIGLESEHESDFDFSASFETPVDSPKVDLN